MAKEDRSDADDDFDAVSKTADRLVKAGKLTRRERDDYIHKHMTGFGYKSKRSYFKADDEEESGGFFSGGRRRSRDDDDDDDV